jgi:predicted neuraminidase
MVLAAGAVSALWMPPVAWAVDPLYQSRLIFDADADPSHGHVHASAIVECPNGDLRACWYENGETLPSPPYLAGDRDKSDDVRIGGSRMAKGASTWDKPFVMSDTFGTSDNNPTMAVDRAGRLWLFHSTMLGAPKWSWGSSLLRYRVSTDYASAGPPRWVRSDLVIPPAVDFSPILAELEKRLESPETLKRYKINPIQAQAYLGHLRENAKEPARLRLGWMPRAHPIVRSDGTLVVPLSNENFNIPMMAMTADAGNTWTFSKPVAEPGLIQPSLVEFSDGEMMAFFRNSDPARRVKRSDSTDGGITWSTPELTDRLHPGAGIEALALKNGHLLLVYNNKEKSPRDKLAVALSTDRGQSWHHERQLEDTPNARFDYPSIVQAKDGTIHVTYSYNLKTIKHVQFNEAWIMQKDAL